MDQKAQNPYVVLIVDDSPEDRAAFVRFLTRDPVQLYTCVQAATAAEALEICRTQDLDCIILDQYLPDMEGVDLLKLLIDTYGLLRFALVMVTGSGNETVAVSAMKYGAQDYLIKAAATPAELRRVINNAINKIQLQREIESQRQQVSIMMESITDAFFAVDSDWQFTFVNDAAEQLLEVSREAVLGKNLWDIFPDAVDGAFYTEYHRAVNERVAVNFEAYFAPLTSWFEVRAYPSPNGLSVYFQNINERKDAEIALRTSQEQLARIFESTSEGIAILNLEGKITLANAAAERILGLDRTQLTLRTYNDRGWHLQDSTGAPLDDEQLPYMQVMRTGRPSYNVEFSITTVSGNNVLLSVNAVPLKDAQGEIEGVVTSFRDITNIKASEAKIRNQAQELQTLIENIPDIVTRFDRELRYMFVSPSIERLMGLPVAEIVGKTNRELGLPTDFCDQWDAALFAVFDTQHGLTFDFSTMVRNQLWHFQARLQPELAINGEVRSVLAITSNITDRKEAEDTLQFLAQASDVLSASLDLQQTYKSITDLIVPRFADSLAIDTLQSDDTLQIQHLGLPTYSISSNADVTTMLMSADYTKDIRLRVVQSGESALLANISAEHMRQHVPSGLLQTIMTEVGQIESVAVVPLVARGATFGVLTLVRTTQRGSFSQRDVMLAEELAARAAVALDNAQLYSTAQHALRERDAFLSVASHEIRNPLTSLLGRVDLLKRRADRNGMDERTKNDIHIIGDQGNRINTLLTDLLDVSRLDAANWQIDRRDVDLANLLRRIVYEITTLSNQHTIEITGIEQSIIMTGDVMRLEQVFRNLLNNAIKYSPQGGSIRIGVTQHNNWAQVNISDQGLGIDPAVQPHVFDRFYRVDTQATRHIGGSGIGLYVVRTFVNAHGGSIEVESRVGHGSTFTVRLPLKASSEQ